MNEQLTWIFNNTHLGWLALLIIVMIIGLVIRRQFKSCNAPLEEATATTSQNWHTETAEVVFEYLKSSPDGLTERAVIQNRVQYGPNQLPEAEVRSWLSRFLYHFHNVLIYVLIAAVAVTAILGHWVDACVILGVVVINAVIGFVQEGKAENALRAIRQMLPPNATVLREGKKMSIAA